MDVYFIRHGESVGNVSKRHQPSFTRLTARGRDQATVVAAQVANIAPTHFITSTQIRALETAELIGEIVGVTPETNELFVELSRPKDMYGWHHRDPRSLWYLLLWYFSFAGSSGTPEAGESYRALRVRVTEARKFLESLPADARVVVVSHSVFINMFLAHHCHHRPLWPHQLALFLWKILRTPNTAIRHLRYTPPASRNCGWEVL